MFGGFLLLAAGGCATPEERATERARRTLEAELVGRWIGDPVKPPAETWFSHARFDMTFNDGGEFSVVASTFDKQPYPLRFLGKYKVRTPAEIVFRPTDANTAFDGLWQAELRDSGKVLVLSTPTSALELVLTKRYGT